LTMKPSVDYHYGSALDSSESTKGRVGHPRRAGQGAISR
jgi:hypothetical protein